MEIIKEQLEGQRKLVQGLEKQRDEIINKFNEQNELLLAMDDVYEAQERLRNMTVTKKLRKVVDLDMIQDMNEAAFEVYVEQLQEMGVNVLDFSNDELQAAFDKYQLNLRGNIQ